MPYDLSKGTPWSNRRKKELSDNDKIRMLENRIEDLENQKLVLQEKLDIAMDAFNKIICASTVAKVIDLFMIAQTATTKIKELDHD